MLLASIALIVGLSACADEPTDPPRQTTCQQHGGLSGHIAEVVYGYREFSKISHTSHKVVIQIFCNDKSSFILSPSGDYEVDEDESIPDDGSWHKLKILDEVGQ
jgi:hypothetical protein